MTEVLTESHPHDIVGGIQSGLLKVRIKREAASVP
jgi:hypothetical protein